jgi:Putative auto-transporter adhesin, head GIN domain
MKILTMLSIGLVIGLAGCNLINNPSNIQGSGIAKTEKRAVASFDSLDVNCVGSIEVHSQGQKSLEISGDDNIIPFITTEVKNGTLYIRSGVDTILGKNYRSLYPLPILKSSSLMGSVKLIYQMSRMTESK